MTFEFTPAVPPDRDLDGTLGIKLDRIDDDGTIHATLAIEDRVRQPYGVVHGGAYAAMAESMASAGTFVSVHQDGKIALGLSNNTQFLRSGTQGTVHGTGVPIHRGRTTWVWDITLSDDDERVLAVSRVTIAVRDAK
ncbi:MAG: PaaI family thioesterase [Actinobacteria bacterium]|nr:PaaI family thioesterase [Actinomycetota bacterium]